MNYDHSRTKLRQYAAKIGAEDLLTPEVEAGACLVTYDAGETIMDTGEDIRQILILVEGVFRVYSISEKGKLGVVARSSPPQMLGDIEYMQDLNALHSVQAETRATLISFPIEDVRRYLSGNIAFYRMICNNLIEKLYNTSGAYSKALLYPSKNRLAGYLLERLDGDGCVYFRANEASEHLGITPRHMSRLITAMEREGILCRDRAKTLRILDLNTLTKLADYF